MEIPALWQDGTVFLIGWFLDRQVDVPVMDVAPVGAFGNGDQGRTFLGRNQGGEHKRGIVQPVCNQMNHGRITGLALFLHLSMHGEAPGTDHQSPVGFEHFGPDDHVGNTGFILDGREDHAAGRAGALTHQHKARYVERCTVHAPNGNNVRTTGSSGTAPCQRHLNTAYPLMEAPPIFGNAAA